MKRLYVLVPVFTAAGFFAWSATQLVRAVREEIH